MYGIIFSQDPQNFSSTVQHLRDTRTRTGVEGYTRTPGIVPSVHSMQIAQKLVQTHPTQLLLVARVDVLAIDHFFYVCPLLFFREDGLACRYTGLSACLTVTHCGGHSR